VLKVRYVPSWVPVLVAVVVALGLDAAVVVWAMASVLAPSCGNDVAWATAAALAVAATAVAAGGVVAALVRWCRLRAAGPDGARVRWLGPDDVIIRAGATWPSLLLAAVVMLGFLAVVSAMSLPTGTCG
jgi:hypothetical protein